MKNMHLSGIYEWRWMWHTSIGVLFFLMFGYGPCGIVCKRHEFFFLCWVIELNFVRYCKYKTWFIFNVGLWNWIACGWNSCGIQLCDFNVGLWNWIIKNCSC